MIEIRLIVHDKVYEFVSVLYIQFLKNTIYMILYGMTGNKHEAGLKAHITFEDGKMYSISEEEVRLKCFPNLKRCSS